MEKSLTKERFAFTKNRTRWSLNKFALAGIPIQSERPMNHRIPCAMLDNLCCWRHKSDYLVLVPTILLFYLSVAIGVLETAACLTKVVSSTFFGTSARMLLLSFRSRINKLCGLIDIRAELIQLSLKSFYFYYLPSIKTIGLSEDLSYLYLVIFFFIFLSENISQRRTFSSWSQ